MRNFETILLAYDGSEQGRVALRRCLPLMDTSEVTVHLMAVVPLAGAVAAADGFYTESMYEAERDRIQQILDDGVERLSGYGITATGYLRAGEPAHQIADMATELKTDLIVVGHQQRGVLSRWWRGSVGASLLDRVDCCLLVVQGDDATEPE